MARVFNFKGKTIVHPGTEVFVDVSGMIQPNVTVDRVGSIIAEAPDGQAGVVHVFSDANSVAQYFGLDSDAANAATLFFAPSNDDRVIEGVRILYVYKPNRSSQAERWAVRELEGGPVPANDATDSAIALTELNRVVGALDRDGVSPAYVEIPNTTTGYAENIFQDLVVEIISGWGKGQQKQIAASAENPTDNTKYRLYLREDLEWEILPFQAGYDTRLRIVAPQHLLLAKEFGPNGQRNSVDLEPASSERAFKLNARYNNRTEVVPLSFGGDVAPTLLLKFDPTGDNGLNSFVDPLTWILPPVASGSGLTTASATPTSLDGGAGLTANAQSGRWIVITGTNAAKPAQASLLGKIFKVKSNTVSGLVLHGEGLGSAFAAPDLDGITWRLISFSDAYVEVTGESGQAKTLKVLLKDVGASPLTYVSLDLKKFSTLETLIQKLNSLRGIQATLGDGVNESLNTSRFDFGAAAEHQGREVLGMLTAAVNDGSISLALDNAAAREGSSIFPTSYPYYVVVGEDTAQPTVAKVVGNNGTTTLTIEPLTNSIAGGYAAEAVVALIAHEEVIYRLGSQLAVGPLDSSLGDVVRDSAAKMVEMAQQTYGRFDVIRATSEGSSLYASQIGAGIGESDKGVFKSFYNGDVGDSVVTPDENAPMYPVSWSHGLDQLLRYRSIQTIVPCVSDDLSNWDVGDFERFIVLFDRHLRDADDNRAERNGFLGMDYPLRKGTYQGRVFTRGALDWIRYFNDERLSISNQRVRVYQSSGAEALLPPWGMALLCAGVFQGIETGEGLTFKTINAVEAVARYNDWDALDVDDVREALLGGLLFAELEDASWRIVRGCTTHVSTDNLARTDINVWNIRNKLKRESRQLIDTRFIGRRTGSDSPTVRVRAPATPASVREALTTYLEEKRKEGVIVDSVDEATGRVERAYKDMFVRISGDIGIVRFQAFPATALNFMGVEIGFQLPKLR